MHDSNESGFIKTFIGFLLGLGMVFVLFILGKVEDIKPGEDIPNLSITTPATTATDETELIGPIISNITTISTTSESNGTTTSETTCTKELNTTTTTTSLDDNPNVIVFSDYEIIVVPESTTTTTNYNSDHVVNTSNNFVKTFSRGTYYCYEKTDVMGGSGRLLMDCSIKEGDIKGSIACRYIYEKYGYSYGGVRTTVYLDIPGYQNMSGFYYVDDCCASNDTIDFFFYYASNCPFSNQGVLFDIACYIVN